MAGVLAGRLLDGLGRSAQELFQVFERIDAVELGRFDQGRDATPGLSSFIMTRKQRVLAVEGDGADQVLDWVAIDLLPENWTVLSWNFPFMIPCAGEGGFHEEKQVHRGADSVRAEAG